jgi:hypothetical protein
VTVIDPVADDGPATGLALKPVGIFSLAAIADEINVGVCDGDSSRCDEKGVREAMAFAAGRLASPWPIWDTLGEG